MSEFISELGHCTRINQPISSIRQFHALSDLSRLSFYANVTRAKWSYLAPHYSTDTRRASNNFQSPSCETDISVLVMTTNKLTSARHQRIIISFSEYYGGIFTRYNAVSGHGHLYELLDRLNLDENTKLFNKLRHLLDHLLEVLVRHEPLNEKVKYEVPTWAIYVFIGCALLSTAAAAVGSWINTKSRTRYPRLYTSYYATYSLPLQVQLVNQDKLDCEADCKIDFRIQHTIILWRCEKAIFHIFPEFSNHGHY